jgi:hypothetical protein
LVRALTVIQPPAGSKHQKLLKRDECGSEEVGA